ncbi:MAG: response regulator transcription factor [Clostridiales bacterium]|nr:response regulator transcription factor [Clostridiales bacterium]
MYRIFIVEDDEVIAKQMKLHIEKWGFEVAIDSNLENPMEDFSKFNPDLVLLDVNLPFYNGFFRCTKIREVSRVPVIFVSSASDNMNQVMAMNMGGDDFISKPFSLEVLTAKINAILRRSYDFGPTSSIIEHKGAIFVPNESVINVNGERVELTKNENRIMSILLENKSSIVSRKKLMEKLWDDDCFVDENTLNVNVNRLRKKLENAGLSDFITTKKGQGYIID